MAYSKSQIDRIGNMLVYVTSKLGSLPKTKLLKLIYILEEQSVLKTGEPFTDLKYQYWTQGPVATFINTQITKERNPITDFVFIEKQPQTTKIKAKINFNDSEFSPFDIELMDLVIQNFGSKSTQELIDYTHREDGLWANKNNEHAGQPKKEHMELNLMQILDNLDHNLDLKIAAKEATCFKDYLTKSNA